MSPDVGGTRAGIEKLVENSERQLKAMRDAATGATRRTSVLAPSVPKPVPVPREMNHAEQPSRPTQQPPEAGSGSKSSPALDVNAKARKIFGEFISQ